MIAAVVFALVAVALAFPSLVLVLMYGAIDAY
jgi:hypothetical protein